MEKRKSVVPSALLSVFLCFSLIAKNAYAYPSSVVAAPNGVVRPAGSMSLVSANEAYIAPTFAPYTSLVGVQLGLQGGNNLMPTENVRWGGIELGFDFLSPDLLGTPAAYVKPLFNAKLQVLTETRRSPSFAIGVMNVAPFQQNRSLNLTYFSLSKTLLGSSGNAGRFTVGLGRVLNTFSTESDPYAVSNPVFIGTWPFSAPSHNSLILGYESPLFGKVSFAVDYLGGVSEVSATDVVGTYTFASNCSAGLGMQSDNGRTVTKLSGLAFLSIQTILFQ